MLSIRLLQGQRQCPRLRVVPRLPGVVSDVIMGLTSSLTGVVEPMVTQTAIPSTQTGSMVRVAVVVMPDWGC